MPKLQNALVNPVARLLEDSPQENGERRVYLAVEGLVCSLCADRVQRALRRVPNVTQVGFSPSDDRFSIRYRSDRLLGQAFVRAAASAVIAPQLRRWIGRRGRGRSWSKPGPRGR